MVLEESKMTPGAGDKGEQEEEEEEEEEMEYESDPEEATLSLAMRRREASDDEEGGDVEEERGKPATARIDPRVGIGSDGESDGQGGAAMYDDEEESEMEEEEEVEEVEEEEEEEEFDENDAVEAEIPVVAAAVVESVVEDGQGLSGGEAMLQVKNQMEGGEKKENEPFAVPTAGAFYMHDDRFRDHGSGRHRHTPGGRKLWESKDDRKWGHDKFEEMNLQETQYDKERRKAKGRYRGQSKNRSMDRAHGKGNRFRTYDDRSNQNHTFKTVRGRGPRRYEPPGKNNRGTLSTQTKQSGKLPEITSNNSLGRVSTQTQTSNVHSDSSPGRKYVFASSLSSASPPFYPSGSSAQDISVAKKRDLPAGSTNKNVSPAVIEEKFSTSHSTALLRGKTVADSVGQDRLYIDERIRPVVGKLNNLQLQSSGSSPNNMSQTSESKSRGRGVAMPGQLNYQSAPSNNQLSKVPQQIQPPSVHHRPVQSPAQPSLRVSTQQLGQQSGSGSQASSPPKFLPANSSESGEAVSPTGSNKSKSALVAKGKGTVQGSGRGSFLYSGAQVMGVAHGDQNFPGTPALLPVMQFGSQHPGVAAVGMALPGYVAQPQLGFGNSEMTWVPVLAGAAGALGGTYCPPYLAVDGGYYARPSGQTSSSGVSSKETSTNKPNNGWKPPQRPELVNDEFGQRQNKPRRYSEMNFGQ